MISTIHLVITSALVGIIWIIQRVHYPAFRYIATDKSDDFHSLHTRDITPLVAPLMVGELVIVSYDVYTLRSFDTWVLLALVLVIWVSTFRIQVPLHQKLSARYSQDHVEKLIRSNWIRTLSWTAKLSIMLYQL